MGRIYPPPPARAAAPKQALNPSLCSGGVYCETLRRPWWGREGGQREGGRCTGGALGFGHDGGWGEEADSGLARRASLRGLGGGSHCQALAEEGVPVVAGVVVPQHEPWKQEGGSGLGRGLGAASRLFLTKPRRALGHRLALNHLQREGCQSCAATWALTSQVRGEARLTNGAKLI